jgi:hypothetical protein
VAADPTHTVQSTRAGIKLRCGEEWCQHTYQSRQEPQAAALGMGLSYNPVAPVGTSRRSLTR